MNTGEVNHGVGSGNAARSEEPLLTVRGRDFLDGKIDADEYVNGAHHTAVMWARQEVNSDVTRGRRPLRRITESVLFLAAIAYGVLGAISFLAGIGGGLAPTSFLTGTAFAVLAIYLSYWFRSRDR